MDSIIFSTLLHSLWQGVLLAVLTALIVLFTTKSNARLRYNLFTGCLLLFVLGVGVTFMIELNSANPFFTIHAAKAVSPKPSGAGLTPLIADAVGSPLPGNSWMSYLNRYSSSIVLIWFLIICAKSIRFMVDIRTLFQVRTTKVYHAGALLEEKVSRLALQYGIKQTVKIMQSGMIQVPMVLGHFKPLILVPLGLVNGLSMEEADAILSHELAHIKRKDYLVNLLQSAVEIVFFFNPAVLWVSNMIRTERENCCDDLAVSTAQTKIDYIKALVSCQEFANAVPAYAMAVTGGKKHLVNRVQRLISARNQSLNRIEKAVVGVALISSVIITSAFSGNSAVKQVTAKLHKVTAVIDKKVFQQELQQDTTSKKKAQQLKEVQVAEAKAAREKRLVKAAAERTENHKEPATSDLIYELLLQDKLVKPENDISFKLDNDAFVVNGVTQSDQIHEAYKSKFLKYTGQSVRYSSSHEHTRDAAGAQANYVRENKRNTEEINTQVKSEVKVARSKAQAAQVQARQNKAEMVKVQSEAVVNAKQAQSDASKVQANAVKAQAQAIANTQKAQADAVKAQAVAIAKAKHVQSAAVKTEAEAVVSAKKAEIEVKKGNDMTSDLIADGLIKDKKNLSYKLNIDELVIDGVTQPDVIHRKYMRKYLKTAKQKITVSVSTD